MMRISPDFRIRRFGLQLRNDLMRQIQPLLITCIIACSALIFSLWFSCFTEFHFGKQYYKFFLWTAATFIVTWLPARSFRIFHNKNTGTMALMLPSSQLEKFLSHFLLTGVFPLVALCLFVLLFTETAAHIIPSNGLPLFTFHPFSQDFASSFFLYFLLLHPFFFFGGIFCKTQPLSKTILVLFLVWCTVLICWSLSGIEMPAVRITRSFAETIPLREVPRTHQLLALSDKCTTYGLPVFFWIASYLRFKELEL